MGKIVWLWVVVGALVVLGFISETGQAVAGKGDPRLEVTQAAGKQRLGGGTAITKIDYINKYAEEWGFPVQGEKQIDISWTKDDDTKAIATRIADALNGLKRQDGRGVGDAFEFKVEAFAGGHRVTATKRFDAARLRGIGSSNGFFEGRVASGGILIKYQADPLPGAALFNVTGVGSFGELILAVNGVQVSVPVIGKEDTQIEQEFVSEFLQRGLAAFIDANGVIRVDNVNTEQGAGFHIDDPGLLVELTLVIGDVSVGGTAGLLEGPGSPARSAEGSGPSVPNAAIAGAAAVAVLAVAAGGWYARRRWLR